MINASRLFHTLRYLRPVQIYGRLWFRLYRPRADLRPPPAVRPVSAPWKTPLKKPSCLVGQKRFRFLNEEHEVRSPSDWNDRERGNLWLYNLHYFDDLNAHGAPSRLQWQRDLVARWIEENPPGAGIGWEPYPLSLRIVNWIKWALAGNDLPTGGLLSLAVQTRFLARRLEFHLLGNHLLANAKALVFAGVFFEGPEADRWLAKGLTILADELPEQVLDDGGHFERSPLYHSIILEDLLDLLNLFSLFSTALFSVNLKGRGARRETVTKGSRLSGRDIGGKLSLAGVAGQMVRWLRSMCHPDGQIALFNDAAFGVAASPAELFDYAEQVGVSPAAMLPVWSEVDGELLGALEYGTATVCHLKESGYIRVDHGPMAAIIDVGQIGPDYLPGHAHADTLSFELSLQGKRVIVDSGTSRYDEGVERLRQRGTAAHNTVVIDGEDSSEVWGSFRVARRVRPFGITIGNDGEGRCVIRCAHDGYRRLPGRVIHRRSWTFGEGWMRICDVIEGRFGEALARYHLHPDLEVMEDRHPSQGTARYGKEGVVSWKITGGTAALVTSSYHPEFGLSVPNRCLEVLISGNSCEIEFRWI